GWGQSTPGYAIKAGMKPALIALDLDDTLLSPDLSISDLNADAVSRVLEEGIPVILASGRTIDSMRGYARQLGIDGRGLPMICANGAEVRDTDNEMVLRRLALTPHACRMALTVLQDLGLPAQAYEEGYIVVSEHNKWTEEDCRLTGMGIRLATGHDELAMIPRSKLIASGDPDLISRVYDEVKLRLAGIANVLVSKPCFLEILPPGADKGEALAWVASEMGVSREAVMAVGDSGNDLGMLGWAGIGCAPADARPDVRAVARHVSSRGHAESAVAELLDRFVFNRP
ncbi:MAG: Cof-type HAD-IIB family hydrolase, partial [Spirochaetota bacterium]